MKKHFDKACAQCGLPRARRDRTYCSRLCMGEAFRIIPRTAKQGRGQAQYLFDLGPCEQCAGTDKRRERHHRDGNPLNNAPENIRVLCSTCHHFEHPRVLMLAQCKSCGGEFVPLHHPSRAKFCNECRQTKALPCRRIR